MKPSERFAQREAYVRGEYRGGSGDSKFYTDEEFAVLMRSVGQRKFQADRDRRRRELELLESAQPRGELRLKAEGRHFFVEARVNGVPVRMLVDTGASWCCLSAADARRAGVAADGSVDIATANSRIRTATGTIRRLGIGALTLHALPTTIIERSGRDSILGADALDRFQSVELRDGTMTLKW